GELLIITAGRVQASREPGVSEFSSSERRNLVATFPSRLEESRPPTGRPVPPRPLLVSVADDEWHGERGLGEDHLLEHRVNFPPTRRFLKRASGKRPVANVGHGDLDGILVHRDVEPEHLRRNHNVLGKILGHAAAYHE